MFIHHNGHIIPENECTVSLQDRGWTLGDGVFDTLLVVDGVGQHTDLHFQRLLNDARVLEITVTKNTGYFIQALTDLIHKNNHFTGRYACRTTITRGIAPRGLMPPVDDVPTIIMVLSPLPAIMPADAVTAIIAQTVRRNELSPLSRIKSLNYGDNILALLEARQHHAKEAILLNSQGYVACATTSNIFIREGQQIITPPLSDGVLAGITRHIMIRDNQVIEDSISIERLLNAQEVFTSNSITGIRHLKIMAV